MVTKSTCGTNLRFSCGTIATVCQHSEARSFAPPLPGSGGANDLASLCWRTVSIVPHEKRKFVPKVDFITTPGYLTGPGAREAAGLPPNSGPYKVISTLAIMGFDPVSKCMRVDSLHPGVTREDIAANTGFDLPFADDVCVTAEPTAEELRILRNEVDPSGRVIGKAAK